MSWDFDDILDAACTRRGTPQLIEVCRAVVRGRVGTTGYFWSNGRIGAMVGAGWVRIHRRFGVMSDGIRIETEVIRALKIACRDWSRQRDDWAAFYYSGAGYPPGFGGGACYYQAPGKRGQRLTVGRVGCLGHNKEGADLIGSDEVSKIEPHRANRALVIGEIWRRGEQHGPKHGSLVGLRYHLGENVFLDAYRNKARVWRKGGEVYLETGEEAFIAALCDVLSRGSRAS